MDKENVVIVGAGERLYSMWTTLVHLYHVHAILDNKVNGLISVGGGMEVHAVSDLMNYSFDKVLVMSMNYLLELRDQLLELGVPSDCIIPYLGENRNLKRTDFFYDNDKVKFDNGQILFELDEDSWNGGITDVFFRNVYNFNLTGDTVVIDIGANIGLASLFFASKQNVIKVIGFEPLAGTYEKALHNIGMNPEKIKGKIQIYHNALSNVNEDRCISFHKKARTAFSICSGNTSQKGELIHVRDAAETLIPIFEKFGNKNIVVKMDCEGSEYEVFDSLVRKGLLKKVDIFMIEFHLQDRGVIETYLAQNNFHFIKTNTADYMGFIYAFNIKK